MKDKLLISVIVLSIIAIILSIIFINREEKPNTEQPFYLEDKYYENNNFTEIDNTEINKLITSQESFVVFIYQPMCVTSADFEKVLNQFREQNHINIYKIAFSSIKDTENFSYLEYYPSFIIFNKGTMVDFLEADKEEDLKRYQDLSAFTDWFKTYVKLKENTNNQQENAEAERTNNQKPANDQEASNNQEENNAQQDQNNQANNKNQDSDKGTSQNAAEEMAKLKEKALKDANIKKEKGKVNIYLFWGNGCPHCADEHAFFNKIKYEYREYYNFYDFEVWSSSANKELMHDFAEAMGDDNVTGVPYTIIGEKTFIGFNGEYEEAFKKAIKEQAQNNFDVYFDKIKK